MKSWQIKNTNPQLSASLSGDLDISIILAELLIQRGITTALAARHFLDTDLTQLHDPFAMKDMDRGVARIRQAQADQERVLVCGDYDVDGVTSSALLYKTLKRLGINVSNHIPHRFNDGYGLNENVVPLAKKQGAGLVITVDCGINALREVELFNREGIDVIVIDHHEPATSLPSAYAVIDPKRKDCSYPFPYLASVGLAAKLYQALFGELPQEDLDLVALGTVADVVSLTGENRILVKAGLPRITKTTNKGLAALIDVARIKGKEMTPQYVGFILGPRINATGRMDTALRSLELLLCEDEDKAYELARTLDSLNVKRQKLQRNVVQEAIDQIEQEVNFKEHKVIVLSKEGWHKGVLGIVAAQVAERYYRPSVVISLKEGVGTASARSIEGFHLHEALTHCSQILENFGGHKQAAGLTIREKNIEKFRQSINAFAQDFLSVRDLVPTVAVDMEVPLSSINLRLAQDLGDMEPFGEGNPAPVFCSRKLEVKGTPAVLGRDTLKFWVTDGHVSVSAVGFGMGKYREMIYPGQRIDLAYQVSIDDWNKSPIVQMKIKDIKEA